MSPGGSGRRWSGYRLSCGQLLQTPRLGNRARRRPEINSSANFCLNKTHAHKTTGYIYPNENKMAVVQKLEGMPVEGRGLGEHMQRKGNA